MNLQGLDYNTQRKRLALPEYGREIQKMVDHAVGLPSREERMLCARTIIRQMESKNVQPRTSNDYEQTLWDHLYIMSDGKLDIDWPCDVSNANRISNKPQPMTPPAQSAHLRHYGRLLDEVFERLKAMPAGAERDKLVGYTANQMKRDLLTWGHGSVDDEKVADDLARLTDGKIQLDLSTFRFERIMPLPTDNGMGGKRRRKK